MSKIETLIKELQVKKSKIDYLYYVKKTLEEDKQCPDYDEVRSDVLKSLNPQIDQLIQSIEDDVALAQPETFTAAEIQVLKTVASKIVNRPKDVPVQQTQSVQRTPDNAPPPPTNLPQVEEMSVSDKMNFALAHRDLGGKTATSVDGFTGQIVGLDAPYIYLQSAEGQKRKFKRNEITING